MCECVCVLVEEDVNSPQSCGAFRGRQGTHFSHSIHDIWGSEQTLTTAGSVMFYRQVAVRARGVVGVSQGGMDVDAVCCDINNRLLLRVPVQSVRWIQSLR